MPYIRKLRDECALIEESVALSARVFGSILLVLSSVTAFATDAAPPPNASPANSSICALMGDAMLKTAKTPYTSSSTVALDSYGPGETRSSTGPRMSETIFTGDAVFVKTGGGSWRKIDAKLDALQDLVRKASSKLGDCQDLGSERLGGEPVTVASAYAGAGDFGTKTKLWINKVQGVLVRSETETKFKEGSRHSVVEYKYGSVLPPKL